MLQRKELHLTQDAVSEQIGISKNHLSSIECGKSLPTTKLIIKLCNVLGKTPDYYLIGSITEEADSLIQSIKTLPSQEQRRLIKLINAYLKAYQDSLSEID